MDALLATQRELEPLGLFRGAVVRLRTGKDGHSPDPSIPKLHNRFGLAIEDIDLWGINEAFAS